MIVYLQLKDEEGSENIQELVMLEFQGTIDSEEEKFKGLTLGELYMEQGVMVNLQI